MQAPGRMQLAPTEKRSRGIQRTTNLSIDDCGKQDETFLQVDDNLQGCWFFQVSGILAITVFQDAILLTECFVVCKDGDRGLDHVHSSRH